jgi:pilus assembly protein Flp/PilA
MKRLSRRRQSGQGMTEYIIIVALIAIGTIGVVSVFGDNIRKLFGTSANALNGQAAADTGTSSPDSRMMEKNIVNFADRNN